MSRAFNTDTLTYVPPAQRQLFVKDIAELQRLVDAVLEPLLYTVPDVKALVDELQQMVNVWALERVRDEPDFNTRVLREGLAELRSTLVERSPALVVDKRYWFGDNAGPFAPLPAHLDPYGYEHDAKPPSPPIDIDTATDTE